MFSKLILLAFGFVATTAIFCSAASVLLVGIGAGGSSAFVASVAIASTVMMIGFPFYASRLFALDAETLADDLSRLGEIVDLEAFAESRVDANDVRRYYAATTFRDYELLARVVGSSAMHTRLESSILPEERPTQMLHVLTHAPPPSSSGADPTRILEVGFGKGVNAAFLKATAGASGTTRYVGVDLAPDHVDHARRVHETDDFRFYLGDARNPPDAARDGGPYDIVFGVESMCYLDTDEKMEDFFSFAETRVRSGGRIVIVDGFRADDFDAHSPNARLAMRLAERGMRLGRMPSRGLWKDVASRRGFVVVADVDLTAEALPFWTTGWRVARALLLFAGALVSRYRASDPARAETFANFVAVCTTAHAMRSGAARYGVLVLERAYRKM